MPDPSPETQLVGRADHRMAPRYRFGVFEADAATGELRRKGMRIKLTGQPLQVLFLLLERRGELLTREQIAKELWPEGTFVDYEHGLNSAVNRIREALGDTAGNSRFVETLARRGYRFIASVERVGYIAVAAEEPAPTVSVAVEPAQQPTGLRLLATAEELPRASHRVVEGLFIALQLMYVGYYVGALTNLPEIGDLFAALPGPTEWMMALIVTAALMIPLRAFLLTAVLMHPPGAQAKLLRVWPFVLPFDVFWALAPFLLLHHMSFGLALGCTGLLVYSPFAQRSLVLMGAGAKPDSQQQAFQ